MSYIYFVPNGYMVHGNFISCPSCNSRFKEEASPKPDPWICPHCGTVQKASYIFQVCLTHKNRKVTLALPKEGETLQFNAKKGRAIFTCDKYRHPLDVTEHTELLSEKMLTVLHAAKTRELLLDAFQYYTWGAKRIPFLPDELTVETLFLITRFVGYDKIFYSQLPLALGSIKLAGAFRKPAKRMHHAEHVIKLTRMLDFGQSEEIRVLLFKTPALLFYHKALSAIYSCLGNDPAAFCDLLSTDETHALFEHLAFLTDNPSSAVFLQDYIYEAGKENYLLKLAKYPDLFNDYARSYACLNPRRRDQVKQTFKTGLDPLAFSVNHALPTRLPSFGDTTIHHKDFSFKFIPVSNTAEMRRLGQGLNNPVLEHITPPIRLIDETSCIIGVWKGFKPVASIEIMDNRIFEILGIHDSSFDTLDDTLKEAIAMWKERRGLEEAEGNSYFTSQEDDNYFCF